MTKAVYVVRNRADALTKQHYWSDCFKEFATLAEAEDYAIKEAYSGAPMAIYKVVAIVRPSRPTTEATLG